MTRKEYEATYGVAPVLSNSTLDISPAPIRMTREEYNQTYGQPQPGIFGRTFPKMPDLKDIIQERRGITQDAMAEFKDKPIKSIFRQTGNVLGLAADIGFKTLEKVPVVGQVQRVFMKVFSDTVQRVGDAIGNIPAVQKYAESLTPEQFDNWQETLAATQDFGNFALLATGAERSKTTLADIETKIRDIPKQRVASRDARITNKIAGEIYNIENNYSKLRKANDATKDAGEASRQRIASTDVLADAVDTEGTIRTKQPGGAADRYYEQTLKGKEDVVRQNVANENIKVNLEEVKTAMTRSLADAGLEGADLVRALSGIKKELEGLRLRADEFGNVPLEKIHDAKISMTKNIDYVKDNTPTILYRKALANTYKTLVETKTPKNRFDVAKVNKELGKYYQDLERIKALDGRKVRGGKLGKYFSQISGNLVGGVAGSAVGGPVGMAIGTVVGGEAAGLIKGRTMSSTFGPDRGRVGKPNPILETAKERGNWPPGVDLTKPDPVVGVPKSIEKTKEVFKLEKDIADNVKKQKQAIKAGDFTLVSALKEIYQALVEKLKEIIETIKKAPKNRGFIKNPFAEPQSKSLGNRKTQYSKTPTTNKNGISNETTTSTGKVQQIPTELAQEARKYKSAEEFVNSNKVVFRTETPPPSVVGQNLYGRGKYFSFDNVYGKDTKGYIIPDSLNLKEVSANIAKEFPGAKVGSRFFPEEMKKQVLAEGYDGLKIKGGNPLENGDQIVIYQGVEKIKPTNITTKSQLIDIWKQANNK